MSRFIVPVALAAAACLARPVSVEQPTTKISFSTVLPQPRVDKIDLLFVVDNSTSMADKQKILAGAVPDLLHGLVSPKCVDPRTRAPTGAVADATEPPDRQCPAGSEPAFAPVTDMHIGVVSTSLGSFGLPACAPAPRRHHDDRGRLLARGKDGGAVEAAGDLHFLAWLPEVEANADARRHPPPPVPRITRLEDLDGALGALVEGVGDDGCGLEAQLESARRFLVEPAPPEAIVIEGSAPVARGVDRELLRQRAAFLRPDSLVAIVMLTDEDDASLDPFSFQGTGYRFYEDAPLPHGTAACASDPGSPACTSCAFAPDDPGCAGGGTFTAAEDDLNVRFHRMKPRFGVDPRHPLARYVDAFTEPKVGRCDSPLFAASLPRGDDGEELCALPRGPRSADLVYFAVIGGVAPSLLPDPADLRAEVDWTRILGRDPEAFDASGIDPHMIDATEPRPGLPTGPGLPDPVHGREWTTNGKDLQLACAFDLGLERRCTGPACDCDGEKDIPLCKEDEPSVQIRGKAYPTLRELALARALGPRGIPASLCATQLTDPARDDYGYRPAMRAILTRFEAGLQACLPRALGRTSEGGEVPCLVVATLPDEGPDEDCARFGLSAPEPALLADLRARAVEAEGPAAGRHPICEVPQVTVAPGETCRYERERIGFCYAEGAEGTRCTRALEFTRPAGALLGARFSLQCIQVSGGG